MKFMERRALKKKLKEYKNSLHFVTEQLSGFANETDRGFILWGQLAGFYLDEINKMNYELTIGMKTES